MQTTNVELYTTCDERPVIVTGRLPGSENDNLILQRGNITETWTPFVVWPKIFSVGIENNRSNWYLPPPSFLDYWTSGVQSREEKLV